MQRFAGGVLVANHSTSLVRTPRPGRLTLPPSNLHVIPCPRESLDESLERIRRIAEESGRVDSASRCIVVSLAALSKCFFFPPRLGSSPHHEHVPYAMACPFIFLGSRLRRLASGSRKMPNGGEGGGSGRGEAPDEDTLLQPSFEVQRELIMPPAAAGTPTRPCQGTAWRWGNRDSRVWQEHA